MRKFVVILQVNNIKCVQTSCTVMECLLKYESSYYHGSHFVNVVFAREKYTLKKNRFTKCKSFIPNILHTYDTV